MEYDTVEKNGILKLVDKLVDLKNIILSKVTQTQKDEYNIHSLISDL